MCVQLTPRLFLVNEIGYRPVKYSEDYEYGKDIIDAGYYKAYNGRAIVEHSNDVLLKEYKNVSLTKHITFV